MPVKSVCVYCGSRAGAMPAYVEDARALGTALAEADWRLVYGAGDVGLMGEVARAAQEGGADALVVGLSDDRWGQQVSAVVQPRSDAHPTLEDLRAFLRPLLSGYKLPRSVAIIDKIPRSATGKANYPAAKEHAEAARLSSQENVDAH